MSRPTGGKPLSPQHTGGSTPSTFSSSTSRTWNSSGVTSYPTPTVSEESTAQAWKHAPALKSLPAGPKSKLPKLRTSPSQGAISAARTAASHGKLHKRGSSASSITTPQTTAFPDFDPNYSPVGASQGITDPAVVCRDLYNPPTLIPASGKIKIKPLLRKLSPQEKTSIDLNRSAAENEGLGIYTSSNSGAAKRGGSDVGYGAGNRSRQFHARTTSGNSQMSTTTTSSSHRPGAQYVHPMRQTPRPYTPPVTHSYEIPSTDSNLSGMKTANIPEEGSERDRVGIHSTSQTGTSSMFSPLVASRRTPPPLHVRTYSSASRLTSNSQTNLPGTPSSLRHYTDSFNPPEVMALTTRSSFDSNFRKGRSRTNTGSATDPAAQIAAVQALRAEFDAREAAKNLKYQEAEAKAQEKEARRREKQDDSQRRKSEAQERKRAKSNPLSEKSVITLPIGAGGYGSSTEGVLSMHTEDEGLNAHPTHRPKRGRTATAGSAGKAVSSQWSLFWFKFKTMWMKFKRTMSGQHSSGGR